MNKIPVSNNSHTFQKFAKILEKIGKNVLVIFNFQEGVPFLLSIILLVLPYGVDNIPEFEKFKILLKKF